MTNQERMERIELPEELENVILEAVDLGRKKKNRLIWKRVGLGCVGATAAFAVLVAAGFVSPVTARAFEGIPAVGKVFTYLYDLAGYEGRYTQIAENAKPALSAEQKEFGSEEFRQDESMGEQQETAGQQGMISQQGTIGQQEPTGQQGGAKQQETEGQQNTVVTSDSGITITVREYFCDKKNLYLSMSIESEVPFVEGGVEENTEGSALVFTGEETLSYEGMESFPTGNGSLHVDGVYLDDHTFVGIARSEWRNVKEGDFDIPDEMIYTADTKHLKLYIPNVATVDFRGEWEFSMEILCEEDTVEVLPVEAVGEDGSSICEVRLQPYEIQVVTDSGNSGVTLTEEEKMLIAFDGKGNMLDWAGNILSFGENGKEVYEYARPENLSGLELFIVDEDSWMNQWKGRLYDGSMTGSDMVEFLKDKCILHVFVHCNK